MRVERHFIWIEKRRMKKWISGGWQKRRKICQRAGTKKG
jgi:hypothetical protein